VVEFIIGRGDRTVAGDIALTPRAKKVIELSVDEARRLNHHYIGTEHLLLGLVREGEGIAAGVLESLGVSLDKVRSQVIYVLSQSGAYSQEGQGAPHGKSSKTPVIDQLGMDLTAAARAGKLDPVIGRFKEIERVVQILSRRTKNNPALIGEPGVGKTAIVEGLAQRIATGDVPETLMGKRLLTLDISCRECGHQTSLTKGEIRHWGCGPEAELREHPHGTARVPVPVDAPLPPAQIPRLPGWPPVQRTPRDDGRRNRVA
jgi:ATP-dependent Clp protease ATP-binding subunit ClpC